ncbi:MAG: hypothetical protein A2X36_17370 [Elusimicrobia bacterium GWA2_69_24]|nr:MAG: hypothetical protein A2X36_17370 [Elusimicrobia bacterium GWA2_69_24]
MACAKPPTQDLADAENAVKAAVEAGAQDYAAAEMAAAQSAWTEAQGKLQAKDYKAAKAAALDTKIKAETAKAAAANGMLAAQSAVQQKLGTLKPEIEPLLAAAAALKGKDSEQVKADAAELEALLKGVETDFGAGQFKPAAEKADALQPKLDALKTAVEAAQKAAAKPAGKKKRR